MTQHKLSLLRVTQPLTVTLVPTGGNVCCALAPLVSIMPASAAAAKSKPRFLIVCLPQIKCYGTLHNLSDRATASPAHVSEGCKNAGTHCPAARFIFALHRQRDFSWTCKIRSFWT